MDTAACDDGYVTVISDKEIIIYGLSKSCLTDDNRDMHAFSYCVVRYADVYAGLILFGGYLYMLCGTPACAFTVGSYVVRACGDLMQSCDLSQ